MMEMYDRIRSIVGDKSLPVGGIAESGEHFVIEQGKDDAGNCYRIIILQDNGWLRIKTYYACGDTNETYRK